MNRYQCNTCGGYCYTAAGPESLLSDDCTYPGCDGQVVLAPEESGTEN